MLKFQSISWRSQTIFECQPKDNSVSQLPTLDPQRCFIGTLDIHPIVCCHETPAQECCEIVVPTNMSLKLVDWHHNITAHSAGVDKLEALIKRHFYHPDLCKACCQVISKCEICPQVCTTCRPASQWAPQHATLLPWSGVHVDFIGPWKVTVNKQEMAFDALTCIDPVTDLIKIACLAGPNVRIPVPTANTKVQCKAMLE